MSFSVIKASIPDVLILEPTVHKVDDGFFFESFNCRDFADATGLDVNFIQDNHSLSERHVLRGLHYQIQHPQGKLLRVIKGTVLDVSVDLRRSSPTFGQWVGCELSDKNHRQLWVPPGFAHGFVVLSERAEFLYKTTDYWYPEHERCLLWNDPAIGIDWQLNGTVPKLAPKDAVGKPFLEAECFE
jgi:dTDP-4-dehydrorhamnose 3,5-epimerase